jgi:DNA polymerase-1
MLASMETNGMPVDVDAIKKLGAHFQQEIDQLRFKIQPHAWPGFNPASPDQVAELLFGRLHLKPGKKTASGTRFTTDDKTLERLKHDHSVVPLFQEFREVDKLKGTFVDGILSALTPELRLHTHLNHASVVSGRLSSSDPNMQNIPTESERGKLIRMCFRVLYGKRLGVYDLSQIELRVLADFTHDPVMTDAFKRGQDLHLKTASEISGTPYDQCDKHHPLRYPSKRFNFGMAYGISDEGLKDQLAMQGIIWTVEEVAKFRKEWFRVYAYVRPAMEAVWAYVRKHGYAVDTWGRPRRLPGIWSDSPRIRSESERMAFNHVIQGGAAGIIKKIMARLWLETAAMENALLAPLLWLLQVHDELLLEMYDWCDTKKVEEWVLNAMKTTVQLSVPMFGDGKVVMAWGEAK